MIQVRMAKMPGDQLETMFLELRRDGLYDGLPEAIFHGAGTGRSMKRNAEEDRHEQRARDFFLPFEQEAHRLRMALRAQADGAIASGSGHTEATALAALWMLPRNLNKVDRERLLYVLPYANSIIGDLEATAACFAQVLGYPVRITRHMPTPLPVSEQLQAQLGGAALGVDFVAGDRFHDGWPMLEVEVLEIPATILADPATRRRLHTLTTLLSGYLLPVHLEVSMYFRVHHNDEGFAIGDGERPSFLAMNTRL
jgi:hypothetical protein